MTHRMAYVIAVTALLASSASADDGEEKIELDFKQGYVVIDTDVRRTVSDWQLEGKVSMGRLPIGRTIKLMPLRPGTYQWTEISVPYYDLPHALDLSDDPRWSFRVERHKINYFGSLVVGEDRGTKTVDARIVNRAAEVIELLREQYPEQMKLYELTYAGHTRDDFLALIQTDAAEAN